MEAKACRRFFLNVDLIGFFGKKTFCLGQGWQNPKSLGMQFGFFKKPEIKPIKLSKY
jgi:hypothetical protein